MPAFSTVKEEESTQRFHPKFWRDLKSYGAKQRKELRGLCTASNSSADHREKTGRPPRHPRSDVRFQRDDSHASMSSMNNRQLYADVCEAALGFPKLAREVQTKFSIHRRRCHRSADNSSKAHPAGPQTVHTERAYLEERPCQQEMSDFEFFLPFFSNLYEFVGICNIFLSKFRCTCGGIILPCDKA